MQLSERNERHQVARAILMLLVEILDRDVRHLPLPHAAAAVQPGGAKAGSRAPATSSSGSSLSTSTCSAATPRRAQATRKISACGFAWPIARAYAKAEMVFQADALEVEVAVGDADQRQGAPLAQRARERVGIAFDFVARGVGTSNAASRIGAHAARGERTFSRLRGEIMREIRTFKRHRLAKLAHCGNRPCGGDVRMLGAQPLVEALFGVPYRRMNRPQRVVEVERDRETRTLPRRLPLVLLGVGRVFARR